MAGLLDYTSSVAGEAKKNVQGLLADPKQALKDILNNLTSKAAAQQAANKAAWATRDPKVMAQNALDSSQTALGFAPLGITAWHGSPHKFNKFSMDKIGTGEGAQAYGHGLYLAESPEVAKEYKRALSGVKLNDGSVINPDWTDPAYYGVQALAKSGGDVAKARANVVEFANKSKWPEVVDSFDSLVSKGANLDATGQLYKTDIPEEAVARFLDWDKPLSQQSKEVQAAMAKFYGVGADDFAKMMRLDPDKFDKSGQQLINDLAGRLNARNLSPLSGNTQASNYLKDAGIPGIRYLDGSSHSAGQGSSNYVAFDPEMIRILERNGQATGAVPWQPGEWRGLLGNN